MPQKLGQRRTRVKCDTLFESHSLNTTKFERIDSGSSVGMKVNSTAAAAADTSYKESKHDSMIKIENLSYCRYKIINILKGDMHETVSCDLSDRLMKLL